MKRYFTKEHEWIVAESETRYIIGITEHACQELGDIVFLELPEVGRHVSVGDAIGVVESVKAASDIYAPLEGTVAEINSQLSENPESLSDDPEGNGWLLKIDVSVENAPKADGTTVFNESQYRSFLAGN